jgi:hypothetical protein
MKYALRIYFKQAALLVFLVLLGIPFARDIHAQKLNSHVKLLLERLPLEKQKKLENFASDIESYINDYDWTGQEADFEIPLSLQIYLQDISANFEERYSGTFLISNTVDIQYYDKYWRFPYQAGDRLIHDESAFQPFMGFLDFYVNLVLGGEFDKTSSLGGTPFYEKAKLINEQAKFNTQFMLGWDERSKLIQSILNQDNVPFRKSKYLFFAAFYYAGQKDTSAQKYALQGVSILESILKQDPEHKEALDYIQAHYMQIADIFKDDNAMLQRMIAMDPVHKEAYQRVIDK